MPTFSGPISPSPSISHPPLIVKRAATSRIAYKSNLERVKTRTGLPLTLNAATGPATILACADSGSEENIISLDLAQALSYEIDASALQKRQFMLANGSIIEAVGAIVVECSFGLEENPAVAPMSCIFYVFMKLASPLIMGFAFLEQTMTLSKHRHRLIKTPRPAHRPLQVYSVGRPRNQLFCYLNTLYVPAIPDSGSEINLMTRRFAQKKGFSIEEGKEVVEFADGSVAMTTGIVRGRLEVRKYEGSLKLTRIPEVLFYLLENLRHDLIIGEDPLEELDIFASGQHLLFPAWDTTGPSALNRIRHLGTFDDVLSRVKKTLGRNRTRQLLSTPNGISVPNTFADQQENDRREREEIRIALLPIDQQGSAIAAETLRQAQYDNTSRSNP
ncbi:hypothetical protein CC86DRAFT_300401 [Ophiobolus disseminans]|uniref:Peptidase A2 domain-containing protein n=1 Tax=Ophiobolus disseminans TaxID=1469910 RepID=A0A6A6ZNN2_9PLEO|nr:hypothetical protein CC86DRAFT_300401 [Ophiobolus disseminans]